MVRNKKIYAVLIAAFTALSSQVLVGQEYPDSLTVPATDSPVAEPVCMNVHAPLVRTGIEVLRDRGFDVLQGKRIGLVTNPSGVDSNLNSTIDILYGAEGVKLVALYGPEHGVRGDKYAGDKVGEETDLTTGLPVHSLYGASRKPTAKMLEGLDAVVYDIQDIGVRSYTFISTLGLVMEACGELGIEVIVLDRPNPLGGLKVEGPLVRDGYHSFISQYKIPYVYGLTVGELALMLNSEGLNCGQRGTQKPARCNLTVIPMEGWTRDMLYIETRLPWVLPSPNIPFCDTPQYYASAGIAGELSNFLQIGIGYTLPFQVFAAQWIDPAALKAELDSYELPGVAFRTIVYKPFSGSQAGKLVKGVQYFFTDYEKASITEVQFRVLQAIARLYPDRRAFEAATAVGAFDKVCGTNYVREAFGRRYIGILTRKDSGKCQRSIGSTDSRWTLCITMEHNASGIYVSAKTIFMRTYRAVVAAMLIALAAFQTDGYAQSRRTSTSSSTERQSSSSARRSSSSERQSSSSARQSSSTSRQSSSSARQSSSTPRQSSSSVRQSSSTPRQSSSSARSSSSTSRKTSSSTRQSASSSARQTPSSDRTTTVGRQTTTRQPAASASVRKAKSLDGNNGTSSVRNATTSERSSSVRNLPPTSAAARADGDRPGGNVGNNPRPDDHHGRPQPPRDDFRPQHPRDRGYIDFDRRPPHRFYDPHHDHCFGYRVHTLPAGYWYRDWHGVRYYCYNDIYYRYIDGCYIVCRPPFGTSLAAAIVADATWTAVRISYYNTLNNTYDKINSNNAYIAEQNEQIARNNALLAQQNSTLAAQAQYMQVRSSNAYQLALAMGLVQSYAAAGTDYFCQDGVFYQNVNGQYYVIVPPAGALVDALPEDYDVFTFNGREYYQVDNTVYRVTVVSGKAYFEVLGQKY